MVNLKVLAAIAVCGLAIGFSVTESKANVSSNDTVSVCQPIKLWQEQHLNARENSGYFKVRISSARAPGKAISVIITNQLIQQHCKSLLKQAMQESNLTGIAKVNARYYMNDTTTQSESIPVIQGVIYSK